jgi:hypothetical protein
MEQLRAFSSGMGTQSVAALVLSAQGIIDYPTHIFSNVGDDSEDPKTLRYLREIAMPYAEKHGIRIIEAKRVMRDGTERTLLEDLERDSRTINIPVRMANGAPGNRNCTHVYKLKVIGKALKALGATKDVPAIVGIGFTIDEIRRMNTTRRGIAWEVPTYPLVGVGDDTGLRLSRSDCERIISEAGLPQPGKSACWFCPMKKPSQWADQRRQEPLMFAQACDLEAQLIKRRESFGKDAAYFTRFGKPLAEAIPDDEVMFELGDLDDAECDSGACFT